VAQLVPALPDLGGAGEHPIHPNKKFAPAASFAEEVGVLIESILGRNRNE
jgi:hypothetical protein